MNALGVWFIGCIVRCTVLAAAGLALGAILRRRGPATGSLVSLTTLVVLLAVPVLGLLPLPRWWTVGPLFAARDGDARAAVPAVIEAGPAEASRATDSTRSPIVEQPQSQDSWLVTFAAEFERELRRPLVPEKSLRWGWPAWVALAVLTGLALGLVRLLLGLRAVAVLRRRSTPIADPELLETLDLCRAEMSCVRPVFVLESPDVATPATVGWRRPAIVLPAEWREWDAQERQVVLAHELAHISRRDYPSGVLAQLSVAFHFYHPMAHWLAARLRLQQELAADAWGARIAGGTRPYVTTLAQMALRRAERPLTWPVRPLLPTRGTFLRRLEMLRDETRILHAPLSRKGRAVTISTLIAAGLLVTGFRGPDSLPSAFAQGTDAQKASEPANPLAYVPADAAFLISLRPAELLTHPDFASISAVIKEHLAQQSPLPFPPEDVSQAAVFWLKSRVGGGGGVPRGSLGPPSAIIVQTTRSQDVKKILAKFGPDAEEVSYQDQTYYRTKANDGYCLFASGGRTFVVAEELLLRDMIKQGPSASARHSWDKAWKEIDRGQAAVAVDGEWFRAELRPQLEPGQPATVAFGSFSPVWEKTRTLALGVNAIGGLKLDLVATCEAAADAKDVGDTLRAIVTLARNTMRNLHQQARTAQGRPNRAMAELLYLSDVIDPLLEKADVKVEEADERSSVRLSAATDLNVSRVVKSLLPPIAAARAAARHAQGINNLKQIGLAFHNFASANNHFPAAAGYASNGRFPHSWRVAILPYLDQSELYNQYRFDEPWDSENNRKLIDRMPAVFRDPAADSKSMSPSYFVLRGPNTIFNDEKGTPFTSITDGTSNTILVVQAKRDIPWTKPEDIPYDPQKPLPELGGYRETGFDVLFADGSVRLVERPAPETLRALISMNGGEIVGQDALEQAPSRRLQLTQPPQATTPNPRR